MGGVADRAAQIVNRGSVRQSYHEQDGKVTVRTSQDVEPHMEYAAKLRRQDRERGRFAKKGEFRHTMSTPFNVYYAVAQKLGIPLSKIFDKDVSKRIDKELKSPEFAAFRVVNGKI
jgi:hypothetical protein